MPNSEVMYDYNLLPIPLQISSINGSIAALGTGIRASTKYGNISRATLAK